MTNEQIYRQFQQSPLKFVFAMWKLKPQGIKKEFRDDVEIYANNGQWEKIKAEHFEPFQKDKEITWQQWIVLKAVERGLIGQAPKKISVVSGHGTGKSSVMSMLILWYLFCFKNCQIGATAPTADQLHSVLWKELKIWLDRMPKEISVLFDWQNDSLRVKQYAETWFARARTARKENTEAIAGLHADYVFICCDEASGIDDAIYKSAEGSLTGPNTLAVLISNGTRNLGYFYDTHHTDKAYWQTLSFSSEDSPIVEKDYVQRIEQKYGRDSDEFKIRVLGRFPASEQMDEQGWIPLITEKDIRQVSGGIPFVGKKYLGIDPSGEGDDTTRWTLRDRFQARVIATEATSSDKTIAKKTYDLIKEYELEPQDVVVGNFGTGADVRAELLLLDHRLDIQTVNEGDSATDGVYLNIRAEMAFRMRSWLVRGGALVGDELKRDVLGYHYKNSLSGKKQLMDKPNLKKRMGRSPDRGDSLMMSFAYDGGLDVHSNEQVEYPKTDTQVDAFSPI